MNTHLNQSTTIDISDLPSNARQEIQDFYAFLRTKYVSKQEQDENAKLRFFKNVKKHRFHLPNDYSFNREVANER